MSKHDVKLAVAAEITGAREAAGLSKRQLARRLGLTPSYVVQWEQGNGVSQHYVYAIDQALDLPLGTIFARAGDRLDGSISHTAWMGCLLPHLREWSLPRPGEALIGA